MGSSGNYDFHCECSEKSNWSESEIEQSWFVCVLIFNATQERDYTESVMLSEHHTGKGSYWISFAVRTLHRKGVILNQSCCLNITQERGHTESVMPSEHYTGKRSYWISHAVWKLHRKAIILDQSCCLNITQERGHTESVMLSEHYTRKGSCWISYAIWTLLKHPNWYKKQVILKIMAKVQKCWSHHLVECTVKL